ncbi:hypothetical protein RRG08_030605 [Elysia crispata]|uniref:Uncharacterized protein n=1 Tax=Elysia crispata TaxID=231223 RepID=A0AAE0Y4A3_9GAST|nr:hypothetical protein RRG08_030605 [Elysia crispata]
MNTKAEGAVPPYFDLISTYRSKKQTHGSSFTGQPNCEIPDTDVFLLLLFFCETIGKTLRFNTGCDNHSRLINVSKVESTLSKQLRDTLLGLHALHVTGCDTTSCFAGKRKLKAL